MVRPTAFLFTSLLAAACGGGAPDPVAPAPEPPAEPAAADPMPIEEPAPSEPAEPAEPEPPAAWADDLSKEQKMAFMKANVLPKMSALFQSMSAEHYKDFSCANCHGPDWKLPKDFLPELEMKNGKFTAAKDKPEVVEFMMNKVVPEMAGIFGKPVYDPKTNTGFGCAGCHTVKM